MEENTKVKLYGFWASPYVRWIKIALQIKGIPYEYVEEDIKRKSQSLLEYNPIYKRVPLLVHEGKPIAESFVILQYIDETWKCSPHLLPPDPYSRSMVLFWADFMLNKIYISLKRLLAGHQEKKNAKEFKMNMKILEENMQNILFPCDFPLCGEDIGMLDILLSTLENDIKTIEEALNVNLMEPEQFPSTFSRMESLSVLAVVKSSTPPHEKLVKFYRVYKFFNRTIPCGIRVGRL